MKYNLKNRPRFHRVTSGKWDYVEYDSKEVTEWFEGFEKEIREIVEDARKMHPKGPYRGMVVLGEEILGEEEK